MASAGFAAGEPSAQTVRVLLASIPADAAVTISGQGLQVCVNGGPWTPCQQTVLQAVSDTPSAAYRAEGGVLAVFGKVRKSIPGTVHVRYAPARTLVAEVPLETYVCGVVQAEMGASAPLEALKAQAVAARSYALASADRHSVRQADVCDTTHCQAWKAPETIAPAALQAAADTRGEYLERDGRPFLALYSACCGGQLAPPGEAPDGAAGRADAPPEGPAYCAAFPGAEWELRLTQDELLKAIGIADAAAVTRISVYERDASGRIARLKVFSEASEADLTGADLRRLLGTSRLRSLLARVQADPVTGDIIFRGSGWGHGKGLCQWGAIGMAGPPHNRTYRQILEHYYPGAAVVCGAALQTATQPARPGP